MNYLLIVLGTISLVLGVVGIFVPLLPTTPLLLLTAFLWTRSSPRLYHWLLSHRRLGGYIRSFMEHQALPLHAKVLSLGMMWAAMLFCIFGLCREFLWLQIVLGFIAIAVTVHILSYPTLKK